MIFKIVELEGPTRDTVLPVVGSEVELKRLGRQVLAAKGGTGIGRDFQIQIYGAAPIAGPMNDLLLVILVIVRILWVTSNLI